MRRTPIVAACTLAALLLALSPREATAQAAFLAEDILPGASSSGPSDFAELGGITLFAATDPVNGRELWRTDGTPFGTSMVRNIRPGAAGSNPQELVRLGAFVYFRANDGSSGIELWRSNGTVGGTTRVKDILPGTASSLPNNFVELGGLLYFAAEGPGTGQELWRSDGTDAGTVLVVDLWPGADWSAPDFLTVIGTTIYFTADDGVSGFELWRYDIGTGAVQIADLQPGIDHSLPSLFTEVGGLVYFVAFQPATGRELWRTDGTAPGTVFLGDLFPGGSSSHPVELVPFLGRVFFSAETPAGRELWSSDGTPAGTTMVEDIRPGGFGSISPPAFPRVFGGLLYFPADDGVNGRELWASDGTAAGTQLAVDIHPAGNSSPSHLVEWNGDLLFGADDGTVGSELWRSDGTPGGTALLQDLDPGVGSSSPGYFVAAQSDLLFTASLPATGNELWILKADPLDFGDAPATYGTLLANDGARHSIVFDFHLGAAVDFEADGQPDPSAGNDDINRPVDDEDGVVFTSPVGVGGTATLDVTAGAPGLLDAWVDFDLDGVFQHPAEQIFAAEPLSTGVNALAFSVPQVPAGFTYSRFRFSSAGGLAPTGAAADGEVEDHALDLEVVEVLDFGDAPEPTYPTTLDQDGARHAIGGPRLGAGVDDETDGLASAGADGDDLDGADDEDGVTFPYKLAVGESTVIAVVAACDAGPFGCAPLLDAWIDFGGDGTWDEPADRIFTSAPLAEGVNLLTVAIPGGAVVGSTFARFRVSSAGALTPAGAAGDGEVEDEPIELHPAVVFDSGGFEDGTFGDWIVVTP
jgi:ELWxxDGT repeat protein